MRVVILGSAAGGGVPQWNCACDNCQAARQGVGVAPRMQDSVAVSGDGRRWFLLNASPDVTRQIESHGSLRPQLSEAGRRESPVAGVVLTNGDLDHCLGLLSLREWTPFSLYATQETQVGLFEHNVMFRTLNRQRPHVVFRPLELDELQPLVDGEGRPSGLEVRAFAVAGKVPLHFEGLSTSSAQSNVGLIVEEAVSGARLVYVPGAADTEAIRERSQDAQALLFDGTCWSDDELGRVGPAHRTARKMAHLPIGGPGGSLERLKDVKVEHRLYTHLNNTNPVLRTDSPERRLLESQGWIVAHDGMELTL